MIESSIEKYQYQLKELDLLESFLRSSVKPWFWQKIRWRFDLLLRHRALIDHLHSIAHNMANRFEEMSGYASGQLKHTLALKTVKVDPSNRLADGIDLRIGRETTIVYVGKKR